MRLIQAGLLFLAPWGVSAELFGDTLNHQAVNFTDLGTVRVPEELLTSRLPDDTYEEKNLTLVEIPDSYRALLELQKREWQSGIAYAVAGGAMAATGLAAIGPEYPVIAVRLWLVRDTPTYDKADVWKRAQTVTLFEHAAAYAFFAIGGGFVGQCIGNWGDLVSGVIGNAFASGATKDVREDKKKRDHELHRQGFLERWDHDSRQHDELKRSGNNCSPLESALVYNSDIASSADVDDLSHVRVVEADAERRGGHDSGRVRTREPPVDDRCFFLLRAEIVRIRRAAP